MKTCGGVAAKQLALPLGVKEQRNGRVFTFKDPAFMENRAAPVHRWVPWIAGFSCTFVDSVLETYLEASRGKSDTRRALVLDPFAGVGTTPIQAAIRGFDVVGFEINPYVALAAQTKLRAIPVRNFTGWGLYPAPNSKNPWRKKISARSGKSRA